MARHPSSSRTVGSHEIGCEAALNRRTALAAIKYIAAGSALSATARDEEETATATGWPFKCWRRKSSGNNKAAAAKSFGSDSRNPSRVFLNPMRVRETKLALARSSASSNEQPQVSSRSEETKETLRG